MLFYFGYDVSFNFIHAVIVPFCHLFITIIVIDIHCQITLLFTFIVVDMSCYATWKAGITFSSQELSSLHHYFLSFFINFATSFFVI